MAWRLEGTYFENCSCDVVCPCTISALTLPADNDYCRVALVFNVDDGEIDGTDVSRLSLVVVAESGKLMSDGNWRLGLLMDERASAEQAQKLAAVFGGELGGPMADLVPLVGEMMGMESVPIEYENDGRRHRVRAGDAVEIEIEDYVPPGSPTGDVAMLTGMAVPMGSELTIATATSSRVNAFGLDFSNTGKNGHYAPFSWSA